MVYNNFQYKIKDFPETYYINLDDQPERAEYMEYQFSYWNIKNYTRVSAYDGRGDKDLRGLIEGTYPEGMKSAEIGCVTSHLKAIKTWLKASTDEYFVIMEDDCDLDVIKYWPFNWQEFYSKIPYDYDVVQCAVINHTQILIQLHHRFINDSSTACYVINRHHAKKLVRLHCHGKKYKLDQNIKPKAVADALIYNSGNTYSIPLFLYNINLGSTIDNENAREALISHDALWKFWKDQAKMTNWDKMFDYDPFVRLPPGLRIRN